MESVLADFETAPIGEGLRETLRFLKTMTLEPERLGARNVERVRAAGVSDEALGDAAYVAAAFNLIDRLADALGAEPISRTLSRDELLAHEKRFFDRGYLL